MRYGSCATILVVNAYFHPAFTAMAVPSAAPLTTARVELAPPELLTLNPAKQFARNVAEVYSPPITPVDALLTCSSPCSMTTAPPNSIGSPAATVVAPSAPVPPDICSSPPETNSAPLGSATLHTAESKPVPPNSSSNRTL